MASPVSQPASIELARTIVASLVACGVRDVVYSPGSRSAPFAYALAEAEAAGRLRAHIRLDERSAAFYAVGLSRAGLIRKAAASPVALVATSGGAIAEYHAGVAEASHAGLPLIVVSADRPFEMRGVGASQTTIQPGIFAAHCRNVLDIPADQEPDHRLSALVVRAVSAACGALGSRPGPVQINVGLREPLAPTSWPLGAEPPTVHAAHIVPVQPQPVAWESVVDSALRTVIIAGDEACIEVAQWAEDAGVPLLAEPTSGVTHSGAWIPFQQAFLQADYHLQAQIEQVVVVGRPTLSRPVSALLARADVRIVVVAADSEWVDVAGRAACVVPALEAPRAAHTTSDWLTEWQSYAADMRREVARSVEADGLSLVSVARAVWAAPVGCLLVGASNIIRAFDVAADSPAVSPVVSNRGLAGIDGTIATAMGLSTGLGQPVRTIMGDLTFFHDLSSLGHSASEPLANVQVIVCDDDGGGIFDALEYSAPHLRDLYPRWFGTRQTTNIAHAAAAFGATYQEITSLNALCDALHVPIDGVSILHLHLPRPTAEIRTINTLLTSNKSPQHTQPTSR